MKQTLLYVLSSFVIVTFMTACSGQVADEMAVVGNPGLSSDPCAAIDEKVLRLDRFTEVVKHTSAFYLEEKATAIQVPGITVSNNKKQMLKDVEKKYAEYAAEYQKYGCKTTKDRSTEQMADKEAGGFAAALLDSPCDTIDKKLVRVHEFTVMVNNTSAFYLEEKATAMPVPGITVSNNKKQMLRDAKRQEAELLQERQKQGCKAPVPSYTSPTPEKKEVVNKPALSAQPSADSDQKMMKTDDLTTKSSSNTAHMEDKVAAVPVPPKSTVSTVSKNNDKMLSEEKKKDTEVTVEHHNVTVVAPQHVDSAKTADKKAVASESALSSAEDCAALDKELIKLDEFMIMVNNTSAFHLEEKAQAMPVPGITVSNNKKKMLRDAQRKRAELLEEREKYGCGTP
jgi:virulence-associated protein VapD